MEAPRKRKRDAEPSFDLPRWMQNFDVVSPSSAHTPSGEEEEGGDEEEERGPLAGESRGSWRGRKKKKKASRPRLSPEQLSPHMQEELKLPLKNLLRYVLFFQDRPEGMRFALDPTKSYVMPLQYAVRTMWILYQEKDLRTPLRPEIRDIYEEVLGSENVVLLTFMFLCLLNASETSVHYVKYFSPDISKNLYLWFLRCLECEFLKFNGRTNAHGNPEADVQQMEYRCPEELVVAMAFTLSVLGDMSLPKLLGTDDDAPVQ